MRSRTLLAGAAAAALTAFAGASPAGAQPYGYYEFAGDPYAHGYYAPARYHGYRSGPADPCAREAGNRALGWGLVGLLLGGLAGGAAAGAGVVAEGAALGGVVGAVTGGVAGSASAACGTARYSGLPVYGTTRSGVAIYHRPLYDYDGAYAEPYPYYGGGYYERADHGHYREHRYERDDDCCEYRSYRYERRYEEHHDHEDRRDYDDYDYDYPEPRN